MAKIKFIVKEINKPSELALTNLSHVIYQTITKDTCSENNTTTKSDSAEKTIENALQQSMEKTA